MNYVACLRNAVSPCSIPEARATIDRQPDSPPCARYAPAHASPPARPPCTSTARARARAPAPTPAEQAPARASAPACRAGNRRKPARQAPAHSSSPARASARVTRTRDAQAPGPARPARAPARAPARPRARPPCTITAGAPARASSPALPRELARVPRRELPALAEHALREAALWHEVKDRRDQPATRLSVGQQQRLCLARTLATNPEVILMDEPTSALDPQATEAIEHLILRMRGRRTVMLVTHNRAQARRVCDAVARFAVVDGAGTVVETGPAGTVTADAPETGG